MTTQQDAGLMGVVSVGVNFKFILVRPLSPAIGNNKQACYVKTARYIRVMHDMQLNTLINFQICSSLYSGFTISNAHVRMWFRVTSIGTNTSTNVFVHSHKRFPFKYLLPYFVELKRFCQSRDSGGLYRCLGEFLVCLNCDFILRMCT